MICDHTPKLDVRELSKFYRPLPDEFPFDDFILSTTWTETNFGGWRQWFLCPCCERRCAIIYRDGAGPRWGCRVCLKGRYLSEPMTPKDRRLHAAFKVRERLGQTKGGILVRFPPKPKGMHWRTYEKNRIAALHRESEILLHAHADLLGVSVEQAKSSLI
jgi:hypothetical protein